MRIRKAAITSGKWVYTLKNGKALRQAIADEDQLGILTVLRDCWEEIHERFPEEYDEDDLSDELEDIDNEIDNLDNYEEYDMTYEDIEDNINYLLGNLYDFCDAFNIWVAL